MSNTFLNLTRMTRDTITNVHMLYCQISLKFEFSTDFRKYNQIPNYMKTRPVEAEYLHAGGRTDIQTDMTKLEVVF